MSSSAEREGVSTCTTGMYSSTFYAQNPVFTCSTRGVQLLQKISPVDVFNEPHVMQAMSFCSLDEPCPFLQQRLRRPLRFCAHLSCGRSSRVVGSQRAERQITLAVHVTFAHVHPTIPRPVSHALWAKDRRDWCVFVLSKEKYERI